MLLAAYTFPSIHVSSLLRQQLSYHQVTHSVLCCIIMQSQLHCVLSLAAQCIVIGPICVGVCGLPRVCYHDNAKLRASIFTRLGL